MQKSFFLFLFIFGYVVCSKGQTIFAPTNSVWHFETLSDIDPTGYNYSKYEKEKDTLFFGQNCAKIVGKHIQYVYNTPPKYDTAIRQTQYTYTNGDTVFYYNFDYSQFFVLYIFNVNKGDSFTLHVRYPPLGSSTDTTFTVKVDSVTIINIDGQNLRKVYTNRSFTGIGRAYLDNYVERIGALNATDPIGISVFNGGISNGLVRCYKDDQLAYIRSDCEYLAPLSIVEQQSNKYFTAYPNPFNSQFSIGTTPLQEEATLKIFNTFGQKMLEQKYAIRQQCTVATEALVAGVYYCRLFNEQGKIIYSTVLSKNN
jgi:hypothetical protein